MALSTAKPSISSHSFLKGVNVYFLGLSSTFAISATKALQANGGRVYPPKFSSFFQKAAVASVSKHLPSDMTHVLCGDKYKGASSTSILKDLGVEGPLPSSIKVVNQSWLSECLKTKKCVDTAPFEVDMTAKSVAPADCGGGDGGDVLGKHSARGDQQQCASTNGKRPRPAVSSNLFADNSLPLAPPLLQGHPPKRLSYPFIPPNQEWLMYDVGLLHLQVRPPPPAPPPATATAAAVSTDCNTEPIPESFSSPASHPPSAPSPFPIRIAAFDLDSTLIKTRSQKSFASSSTDWQWFHPSVPLTLQALNQQGYKVVIISNQRGIESKNTDLPSLLQRLASVVSSLEIPDMEGFFATHHSVFYKPAPGAWYLLEEKYGEGGGGGGREGGGGEGIDTANSFFVGDAAGRPKQGKMRGRDHSDSDLKLAVNVGGIGFKTPEEFFLGSRLSCDKGEVLKAAMEREGRNAVEGYVVVRREGSGSRNSSSSTGTSSSHLSTGGHNVSIPPSVPFFLSPPTRQEGILLLGPPASGKSTYCHTHLPHHTRINQDTLKSLPKCQRAALDALEKGESIVIDATNSTSKLRKEWVDLLRSCPLPSFPSSSSSSPSSSLLLRVIEFLPPKSATMHLNFFRGMNLDAAAVEGREGGREGGVDFLRWVPERVIHSFFKFIEPVKQDGGKEEGFEEHVQVKELVLKPFRNRREAHLFGCLLPSIR